MSDIQTDANRLIEAFQAEWTDKPHMLTPGVAAAALRRVANVAISETYNNGLAAEQDELPGFNDEDEQKLDFETPQGEQ